MPVINLTSGNHRITLHQETTKLSLRHQAKRIVLHQKTTKLSLRHLVNMIVLHQVGRRGISGVDKNYILDFTNSSQVTVDHSLSKYPAVTITDTSGDEVMGDVEHVSVNQLIARFSNSFSGRIICN